VNVSLTTPRPYNHTMRLLLATVAVLTLLAPPSALAQRAGTNAPPGNSAIDEYLESVPSADGNTPTGSVVRGRPRPLGGAAGRALRGEGQDGRALEEIITATAPPKAIRTAERGGSAVRAPGDTAKGRSPIRSVADALLTGSGGGSGMGAAFPLLLIVLAAGTLVLGLRRRRPQP
jgi:hypothetical protein